MAHQTLRYVFGKVNAAFEAYHSPADQHLRWLILALRGQAMSYWFFEVEPRGQVTSTAQFFQLRHGHGRDLQHGNGGR